MDGQKNKLKEECKLLKSANLSEFINLYSDYQKLEHLQTQLTSDAGLPRFYETLLIASCPSVLTLTYLLCNKFTKLSVKLCTKTLGYRNELAIANMSLIYRQGNKIRRNYLHSLLATLHSAHLPLFHHDPATLSSFSFSNSLTLFSSQGLCTHCYSS